MTPRQRYERARRDEARAKKAIARWTLVELRARERAIRSAGVSRKTACGAARAAAWLLERARGELARAEAEVALALEAIHGTEVLA